MGGWVGTVSFFIIQNSLSIMCMQGRRHGGGEVSPGGTLRGAAKSRFKFNWYIWHWLEYSKIESICKKIRLRRNF